MIVITDALDEKKRGYTSDLNRVSPKVTAPSVRNIEAKIKTREEWLESSRKRLTDPDDRVHVYKNVHDNVLKAMERWETEIESLRTLNPQLGTVFASSGSDRVYTPSTNALKGRPSSTKSAFPNAMSWALLSIDDPTRVGKNTIQKQEEGRFPSPLGSDCEVIAAERDPHEPKQNKHVWCAADQAHKCATMSAQDSYLNLGDGHITTTLTGIGSRYENRDCKFMSSSHVGSWIFDHSGFFWTLFAFAAEEEADLAFIVPVAWIYDDIFQKTWSESCGAGVGIWT